MNENPLGAALARWQEQVGKPWARSIESTFSAFFEEFARSRAETRAKPCPCGCGNTIGAVVGAGIVNLHALSLQSEVADAGSSVE